jgi:hypothetical protein
MIQGKTLKIIYCFFPAYGLESKDLVHQTERAIVVIALSY